MRLPSRGLALALLAAAALAVLLRLLLPELCSAPAPPLPTPPSPLRSLRERRLGVELPLQLPEEVSNYIDALQFPARCDQDTPATVWHSWSWGGPGLGAHFIHWSWTFGAALAMRRTYVARDPDFTFGYNEEGCIHSLFCALHPISACTEAEVDGNSAAAQQARLDGWVYGHYGAQKQLRLSHVTDVRRDPGRIFDSEDYWKAEYYGDPTVSCRATMWLPPQFRTVGSEIEWQELRDACNFSAFDGISDGRSRASWDLLWWRSMIVGYFFQPLPAVMARAAEKAKRAGLPGNGNCLSLHVRRGDKVKEGSPASEGKAHSLAEYMAQAEGLLLPAGPKVLYLASDDLAALLQEWEAGGYGQRWTLLVDRAELPWSVGFNIGRPKRNDEFEETVAAAWTFASCGFMVGSLESYFYKLAMHLAVARGVYRNSSNLFGSRYEIGVMAVPGKSWLNFMP